MPPLSLYVSIDPCIFLSFYLSICSSTSTKYYTYTSTSKTPAPATKSALQGHEILRLPLRYCCYYSTVAALTATAIWNIFSRMRSEGFSFNSGGLGVESCSRSVVSMFATVRNRSQPSATVRNRSQPSATVRSRTLRRCHWGKLLQVTFHGCVTCQFATLFHCDLHENDMSRKKRDAFRCTGAVV